MEPDSTTPDSVTTPEPAPSRSDAAPIPEFVEFWEGMTDDEKSQKRVEIMRMLGVAPTPRERVIWKPPEEPAKKQDSEGRIRVKLPGHAMANKDGWVLESVLVMERVMQRPLKPGEIVMHYNRRHWDNRAANLYLAGDMGVCRGDDCSRKAVTKGLCPSCYQKWREERRKKRAAAQKRGMEARGVTNWHEWGRKKRTAEDGLAAVKSSETHEKQLPPSAGVAQCSPTVIHGNDTTP